MYTKFVLRASTTSNTRLGALNERLLLKLVSNVATVRASTGAGAGAGAGIVDATSGVDAADIGDQVGNVSGLGIGGTVGIVDASVDVDAVVRSSAGIVDVANDGGGDGDGGACLGGACLVRPRNNVDV
jgi:hypothetical protein